MAERKALYRTGIVTDVILKTGSRIPEDTTTTVKSVNIYPDGTDLSQEAREFFHDKKLLDLSVKIKVHKHMGAHPPVLYTVWESVSRNDSSVRIPYPFISNGKFSKVSNN